VLARILAYAHQDPVIHVKIWEDNGKTNITMQARTESVYLQAVRAGRYAEERVDEEVGYSE